MSGSNWRERAGTLFNCEKQPAHGTKGVVVTNHPLGSAASISMPAAMPSTLRSPRNSH